MLCTVVNLWMTAGWVTRECELLVQKVKLSAWGRTASLWDHQIGLTQLSRWFMCLDNFLQATQEKNPNTNNNLKSACGVLDLIASWQVSVLNSKHTGRHWHCNHKLMRAGSGTTSMYHGGWRRMSSNITTERVRERERERGGGGWDTIVLGVKCGILDFSQQFCSIYASHWQQPSQTCLCADVEELWEYVFFFPSQGTDLGCWAELAGCYSNTLSDANDSLMTQTEKKISESWGPIAFWSFV